jgi:hypothetical protein
MYFWKEDDVCKAEGNAQMLFEDLTMVTSAKCLGTRKT